MLPGSTLISSLCPCPPPPHPVVREKLEDLDKRWASPINHFIFSTKWIYSKMRYAASACLLAVTQSGARAWMCSAKKRALVQPWQGALRRILTRNWNKEQLLSVLLLSPSKTRSITPPRERPLPRCWTVHGFIENWGHIVCSGQAGKKWPTPPPPPRKAEWLWLSSKSSPVEKLHLAGGLTELLCSTAGQFSLVLQPGHKSFYFPQAQASVLYTAHHLIKESKVTELVKVTPPFPLVQHW